MPARPRATTHGRGQPGSVINKCPQVCREICKNNRAAWSIRSTLGDFHRRHNQKMVCANSVASMMVFPSQIGRRVPRISVQHRGLESQIFSPVPNCEFCFLTSHFHRFRNRYFFQRRLSRRKQNRAKHCHALFTAKIFKWCRRKILFVSEHCLFHVRY